MSIQAVAWAIRVRAGSPTLKVALMAVANYADENGVCWPSQERLAHDTEMSERSVRDALKKLEEAGLIVRKARFDPETRQRKTDLIYLQSHRKDFPVDEGNRQNLPVASTGKSRREPPAAPAGKPSVEPSDTSFAIAQEDAREAPKPKNASGTNRQQTRKKAGHPIHDAFTITSEFVNIHLAAGHSVEVAENDWEQFVSHHAAKGTLFVNWEQAARNWALKSVARSLQPRQPALGGNRPAHGTVFGAFERVHAKLQAQRRQGGGDGLDLSA